MTTITGNTDLFARFRIARIASAVLLCAAVIVLGGCAAAPQHAYSVCTMHPGTEACQVEQYDHVD